MCRYVRKVKTMTESSPFLINPREAGSTRIDVMLDADRLWLSQKPSTELFGMARAMISGPIKHIFEDGQWTPGATVRLLGTVQLEVEA